MGSAEVWYRVGVAAIVGLVLLRSTALAACPASAPVDFPPMCAGEATTASARICFGDACLLPGVVNGVDPPKLPFEVTGYHLDGGGLSLPISAANFPLLVLPGQTLVADLRVSLITTGKVQGQLTWRVAGGGQDDEGDDKGNKAKKGACPAVLRAEVPRCAAADPTSPCVGAETCTAGVCTPIRVAGPCDDGDPCTIGDTCTDGRCVPGAARDCDDHIACTSDRCTAGVGCVHKPVDSLCDAPDACTGGVCDPTTGCRTKPLSGPSCDDGESCTTDDACVAGRCVGRAVGCDDHRACTEDSCAGGQCTHVSVDARCDRGQCVVAACRPEDAGADGEGCVSTPASEDTPCTDDGMSCTDDVCTGGLCLHVPIDSRCGVGDDCTQAVCAPGGPDRDADGCATTVQASGCPEDGDPCSDDHCDAGRCLHEPIAEWRTCSPVGPAYRKTLALAATARGLNAQIGTEMSGLTTGPSMTTTLGRVVAELDVVAQVLAGKSDELPPLTQESPVGATPAQVRARVASSHVLVALRQLPHVVQTLGGARVRTAVGKEEARLVGRRGRILLRGLKSLKRDLKRLQLESQRFAR